MGIREEEEEEEEAGVWRTPHDIATRETEDQGTAPDTIFPTEID